MSAKKSKAKRKTIFLSPNLDERLTRIIEAQHSKFSPYIIGALIEPHVLEMEAKAKKSKRRVLA